MGTAVNHFVLDWIKPSILIFDIRALWCSRLSISVSGCQIYKWRFKLVWHKKLGNRGRQRVKSYSTHLTCCSCCICDTSHRDTEDCCHGDHCHSDRCQLMLCMYRYNSHLKWRGGNRR